MEYQLKLQLDEIVTYLTEIRHLTYKNLELNINEILFAFYENEILEPSGKLSHLKQDIVIKQFFNQLQKEIEQDNNVPNENNKSKEETFENHKKADYLYE